MPNSITLGLMSVALLIWPAIAYIWCALASSRSLTGPAEVRSDGSTVLRLNPEVSSIGGISAALFLIMTVVFLLSSVRSLPGTALAVAAILINVAMAVICLRGRSLMAVVISGDGLRYIGLIGTPLRIKWRDLVRIWTHHGSHICFLSGNGVRICASARFSGFDHLLAAVEQRVDPAIYGTAVAELRRRLIPRT